MTARKLARGSVQLRTLAPDVLDVLDHAGSPGPTGPQGDPGAPGPAGPGAGRIQYSDTASSTPTPRTALDFSGLKITGACQQSGTTTQLIISVISDQDAVLQVNFNSDTGADPHVPGTLQSGNVQAELQGGIERQLGGPAADSPNFSRVIATILYVSQSRITTLTLAALVDGASGTCSIVGTAVPAS